MKANRNDLEAYARRWLEMGKHDLVAGERLFFTPYDALAEEFRSRGDRLVSFAHYDYLGLSGHPQITRSVAKAVETGGTSAGASRLVGGENSGHRALERDLAKFIGVDDTIALVSGYATNVTLLGHMLGGNDAILLDELSHNSILAGSRLSRAQCLTFAHNDADALEHLLRTRRADFGRVLIVVESLYSMDGDIPDLARLLELRDRYNAWLMVDEAHSIGVLGATGRGISEHCGIEAGRIDLIIGTLSKALVSCGGFIGARSTIVEWLRYTLPGFVYSVGLTPPTTAAAHSALRLIDSNPGLVAKMQSNSRYFLECAKAAGLDTGGAQGLGVTPILRNDVADTILMFRKLLEAGFYVPPIFQVGVPKDKPRLRFFVSAKHRREDIARAVAVMADVDRGVATDHRAAAADLLARQEMPAS